MILIHSIIILRVLINYLLASFFMGKMNDNLPIKYLQAKLEFDKVFNLNSFSLFINNNQLLIA